jgi:putative transposase
MARIARVVAPGHAHHVTQRGNRRQQVFLKDEDYGAYLDLMADWCGMQGVEVWAYCLMPNHVHLLAVPKTSEGLARAIGEAHRRYTRLVNFREGWRGYLWQGRFGSFPMDGAHALACARYIELNPVRAALVKKAEDWRWSSARAHLSGLADVLVKNTKPLRDAGQWASLLKLGTGDADLIRRHERTGRPLGSPSFLDKLETTLERKLKPQKPGRKRKRKEN